jgi:hypothetical protein
VLYVDMRRDSNKSILDGLVRSLKSCAVYEDDLPFWKRVCDEIVVKVDSSFSENMLNQYLLGKISNSFIGKSGNHCRSKKKAN